MQHASLIIVHLTYSTFGPKAYKNLNFMYNYPTRNNFSPSAVNMSEGDIFAVMEDKLDWCRNKFTPIKQENKLI